eukprot:3640750-Pyramimonas_sp.AAC.1
MPWMTVPRQLWSAACELAGGISWRAGCQMPPGDGLAHPGRGGSSEAGALGARCHRTRSSARIATATALRVGRGASPRAVTLPSLGAKLAQAAP